MIKRIKARLSTITNTQEHILRQANELEWAHVFEHSIKGKTNLEKLNLNIGRWAGNFSLFYLLNRIMSDFEPKRIVEFGLGESSRFVMSFNDVYKFEYRAIEHNELWKESFLSKNSNFESQSIVIAQMKTQQKDGFDYNAYINVLDLQFVHEADFYLIDGPLGSKRFSRFDIALICERFKKEKDFVVVLDDYNRLGEKDTGKYIMDSFKARGIVYYSAVFTGNKDQLLICSEKFKFLTSV